MGLGEKYVKQKSSLKYVLNAFNKPQILKFNKQKIFLHCYWLKNINHNVTVSIFFAAFLEESKKRDMTITFK